MPNRMGNAAAILVGALATVTLAVAPNGAAHAADNCLSGPKGAAPKGSHWYYRIDHATKRNCWYVRAEGDKPVASRNSSVAEGAPQPDTQLWPAVANARAEAALGDIGQSTGTATPPASVDAASNGQGSDASATDNGQPTVASRWLDQTGTIVVNNSTPQAVDSGASTKSVPAAAAPLAAADARSVSSPGPVSTLFLVIVGALATAGLLAGAIYRFGSARDGDRQDFSRGQRASWDVVDAGATIRSPPLATEAAAPQAGPALERHEAVIPDEIVQLLSKLSKEAAA